ncbi:hypothetical protein SNEBB_005598 [Seison nebaliae]|nr:hypothetical protein SNEBB_005598 [Seison nebaliae]
MPLKNEICLAAPNGQHLIQILPNQIAKDEWTAICKNLEELDAEKKKLKAIKKNNSIKKNKSIKKRPKRSMVVTQFSNNQVKSRLRTTVHQINENENVNMSNEDIITFLETLCCRKS